MVRHLLMLSVLCLAACKSAPLSPPPPGGVAIDVPGVKIRVADNPTVVTPPPQPVPVYVAPPPLPGR